MPLHIFLAAATEVTAVLHGAGFVAGAITVVGSGGDTDTISSTIRLCPIGDIPWLHGGDGKNGGDAKRLGKAPSKVGGGDGVAV